MDIKNSEKDIMEVKIRHSHFLFKVIREMMCEVNKEDYLTRFIQYVYKRERNYSELAILCAV